MNHGGIGRIVLLSGAFFLAWATIRHFFPLIAPFLLGWFFAAMAEPLTDFIHRKLRLGRSVAAGISVSLVLVILVGLVCMVAALCYRELMGMTSGISSLTQTLESRMDGIRQWASDLAGRAPGKMGNVLRQSVSDLFAGGGVILEKLTSGAISAAGSFAGKLPGGALMLGTAVISAYMIAARYPALKQRFAEGRWKSGKWVSVLRGIGNTAGLWLKAQLKLTGVTFCIVSLGFLILRVEHWLFWATLTALVDAIPLLGTGTVLIPMSLMALLWGEQVRGIGLLGLYVTAMLTRSALEPRLVGRQLGISPLTTLMALYAGFRIWGVAGMILSPLLAVTVIQLVGRAE